METEQQEYTLCTAKFRYDKDCPPLFIRTNSYNNIDGEKSMLNARAEFSKNLRDQSFTQDSILSNGSSAGEYALWLINYNHKKRTNTIAKISVE